MGAHLGTAPAAARRVAAVAAGWASQPPVRLWQRALGTLAYSWLLLRCPSSLAAALLGAAFLLWLAWDAAEAQQLQAALTLKAVAAPLKVADFSQVMGPMGPAGAAAGGEGFVDSEASVRFGDVRRRTHCTFAPKATVWGNDWVQGAGMEGEDCLGANVARCLPRFYRFCLEVKAGAALDGFVFEARGPYYGADLASFADTVRRVLGGVSAADPAGVDCLRKNYVGKRGWYFQFARESFFVTSFAPCYPTTHPRYQFGLHPESCFVLFQPEESFLRHDLPPDKPRSATNWENPVDVRDRIRANFRRNGREYRIPETTSYPPAEFIVPPLDVHGETVRFWLPPPRAALAAAAAEAAAEGHAPPGVGATGAQGEPTGG